MKLLKTKPVPPKLHTLAAGLALALVGGITAQAHPYASGMTPKDPNGYVFFRMNEAGATVTVTFEDNSTLNMGVLPKGQTNFLLGAHTSYTITCFKQGSGSPSVISTDTDTYSTWTTPRGVAVDKNPQVGANFGQICVGHATTSGKGLGLFLLNADQTVVKTNVGSGFWSGGGVGPWRMHANADGTFLVNDWSTPNACLLQFSPDLTSSNLVLAGIGQDTGPSAGIHGDIFGAGIMTGSLAQSNLVLYTFDSGMGVPADTNCIKGPLTDIGQYNCVFRYNIGAGPLPWNKRPDYAYTYGLSGIADLSTEGDIGPDGKVYCAFARANGSNPNLQILGPLPTTNGITGDLANQAVQNAAKAATNWLYTGGVYPPFNQPPPNGDPWNGVNGSGRAGGAFSGVRLSPDHSLIAMVDVNNGVTLANLTNGIPDESTIFGISQGTFGSATGLNSGNSRGFDWDPADNLWIISSGQGLLRCFSLGMTTTCVSSNDWTGTNGTFQLTFPGGKASVATINATASQNYTNNTVNAGAPIPGVFRIRLNTANNPAPVAVGFVRSGSAAFPANYTINTNETPNGVTITPNAVIFPAGVFSGSNGPNWNVDVKITPTALPLSGPTLTCNLRLQSGTNYSAATPLSGSISILNTGPQLVQLTAPSPATLVGMNRGIANDYAQFVITRLGDLNGPGNDAVNPIVQRPLTITNIDYLPPAGGVSFMAQYGVDFTAGAQLFTGSAPVDGTSGIVINPGATTVKAMIGNPVLHTNPNLTRTNLQVLLSLTNTVAIGSPASTTNVLSAEGYQYSVTTGGLLLNEYDNANGGEVVLWSDPLTSAADSANWTLVFASTGGGSDPVLPTVIPSYDNSANVTGGQYEAAFGKSVNDPGNDGGVSVPPSQTMTANGWTTALKVSVNKDPGNAFEAGVNLYPQNMHFGGNYALRFDMYLSLYDYGVNNPTIGSPAREFAAFGINHQGTNANWRLDLNPRPDGTGSYPINADGEWCVIGAASGSITPADYDMFISPAWATFNPATGQPYTNTIPFTTNLYVVAPFTNAYQIQPGVYSGATNYFANAGVPNDQQSANNGALPNAPSPQQGVVKDPPFSGINKLGGAPDNNWIDVSLELTRQTNLTLKVAQQAIFNSSITTPIFGAQNPLAPFTGVPMLGYIDPHQDVSDYSAFVYFSNLRVVELSPFIPWTNQPVAGLIVTQGSSFTLSSGATFASNPLTNTWLTSTYVNRETGTPTGGLLTNVFASTNGLTTLAVNNIQGGTNFVSIWSDQAGAITSYVSVVEVVVPPASKLVAAGTTNGLSVGVSGNAPPTSYQWKFYGTNLVNGPHYAGVTTATLTINGATAADSGVYSNVVANANGSVVVAGTFTVAGGVTPAAQTNLWGSTAQFTVSSSAGTTYAWKKNNLNLADGGNVSGSGTTVLTLSPVTTADAGTYTVGETNGGSGLVVGTGILRVVVPPPSITNTLVAGGNVRLFIATTNSYDTTNAFILQTSPLVQGPYTNVPGATFQGGSGAFNVTIPQTGEPARFYRLEHAN